MENKYKNSYNLLQNDLKNKILMLDGAMGTMIQRENLTADDFGGEKYEGCNDYLVLKRPDIIKILFYKDLTLLKIFIKDIWRLGVILLKLTVLGLWILS